VRFTSPLVKKSHWIFKKQWVALCRLCYVNSRLNFKLWLNNIARCGRQQTVTSCWQKNLKWIKRPSEPVHSHSVKRLTVLQMAMPNKTQQTSLDRSTMNQCRTCTPDSCEILGISHLVIYNTALCCFQRRSYMASPPYPLPVTYRTSDAHSNPYPPLQFFSFPVN